MITPYIKQLQYFKRALVPWSGSRFHQRGKDISLITGKQHKRALTWESRYF